MDICMTSTLNIVIIHPKLTAQEDQSNVSLQLNVKKPLKINIQLHFIIFTIIFSHILLCVSITLEKPQPSKNCPRANGFFPFPAEESCQKFWDCRGGTYFDIYNWIINYKTLYVVIHKEGI